MTRVLGADALDEAAATLASGAVVAIPTDTVYGLAARLDRQSAIDTLFALKDRPRSLPIAVLCATVEVARALARTWPAAAVVLAEEFWPGALTIVVATDRAMAARVGSTDAVGLRVPDDAECAALLALTGPLAVTSANRHGAPPATSAAAVLEGLDAAEVGAVLDDGARDGAVSTVVDVAGPSVEIVREGAIAASAVRAAISAA